MANYIFDFAQTLAQLQPSNVELLSLYLREYVNIDLSQDVLMDAFSYADLYIPYSSVTITDNKQRREFYHRYNHHLLLSLGLNYLVKADDVYSYFSEQKRHWVPTNGAKRAVKTLHERRHALYILSNFDSNLDDIVEEHFHDEYKYFTSILTSQQCGMEKPSPLFLKHLIDKHKLDINNSLFIGDSYHLDYTPASLLGMKCLLVPQNFRQYKHLPFVRESLDFLQSESHWP